MLKMKKLFVLTVTLLLVFSSFSIAQATESHSQISINEFDQDAIYNRVTDYLSFVNESFVSQELDSNKLLSFFDSEKNTDNELYKEAKAIIEVQIKNRKLYKYDIGYSKIDSTFKVDSFKLTDNTATITILESDVRYYNDGRVPEYYSNCPNVFTLILINNVWYIQGHEYNNEFKSYLENMRETKGIDWETAEEQYLKKAEIIINEEITQTENIIKEYGSIAVYNEQYDEANLKAAQDDVSTKSYSWHSYDHSDAKDFAMDYYDETSYPSPYTSYTYDCTNFTSVCLRYGDMPYDTYYSYQWWYTSHTDKSASFTAARYFRDYIINNVGSSSIFGIYSTVGIFATCSEGDIIQLYDDDDEAYHSMFVLYPCTYNGEADVYLAQHTPNALVYLSSKPATRYYRDIYGYYS